MVMDRERIEELVEILKASSAAEISCREGDSFIRIRQGNAGGKLRAETASTVLPDGPLTQLEVSVNDAETVPVRVKLVGTFHQQREGGSEPVTEPGAQVAEGQVVGVVETLGNWADIVSPVAGQVVGIVAEEGAPVQYGDVVMLIRPQEAE